MYQSLNLVTHTEISTFPCPILWWCACLWGAFLYKTTFFDIAVGTIRSFWIHFSDAWHLLGRNYVRVESSGPPSPNILRLIWNCNIMFSKFDNHLPLVDCLLFLDPVVVGPQQLLLVLLLHLVDLSVIETSHLDTWKLKKKKKKK